jgi:KDO2-lipid IV(A) lauroyltransferase
MIKVLRMLRKGAFVGILGDQYAGHEGISLRFFGRETSCYFGAAALALMAKVPLVPVISWREAPFSHLVRICPPLFPFSGDSGDEAGEKALSREKRIEDLTEKGNRLLENWIREHPEQWLWLHRRFR